MTLQGRIYLVGMPGSGKSYFGKKLQELFSYPLIDMDKVIEEREGMEITAIFSEKGEPYFREMEAKVLRELTDEYVEAIISTGGGTPCFHEGMTYMNSHGTTIFLETDREVLIDRLGRKAHRPLVQGDVDGRVDALLRERLPVYQQAHITIAHRDPALMLEAIDALKK